MSDINTKEYSVAQLRAWLQQLNLPVSGSKAALVLRLNAVPSEERGICLCLREQDGGAVSDNDSEVNDDDNGVNDISASVSNGNSNGDNVRSREVTLLEKEIDLMKKEKLILAKEIELLKLEARTTVSPNSINTNVDAGFTIVKDSIPDFDGNGNVDQWTSQLLHAAKMFSLSDDVLKTLLWCKVKGCAQLWLISKADYISINVHILIDEIREVFKPKISKLKMRRKFEERKWIYGESFASYYNEKILL